MDWEKYQKMTSLRKVRPLLLEAVKHVKNKESALDFGAGSLVDSNALIELGFSKVVAVDSTGENTIKHPRFFFKNLSFEEYTPLPGSFDLINAQFALPFIKSKDFPFVWSRLILSV